MEDVSLTGILVDLSRREVSMVFRVRSPTLAKVLKILAWWVTFSRLGGKKMGDERVHVTGF
jgi:hypothetical protein